MKARTRKSIHKLLHKYRLIVINEDTFEERVSFKLNRLNVFVFGGIITILVVFTTIILISFTNLKEYIPGRSSELLHQKGIELVLKVDSLELKLLENKRYIESIRKVLAGDVQDNKNIHKDSTHLNLKDLKIEIPNPIAEDLALRQEVALEDKYNFEEINFNSELMQNPVEGKVIEKFNNQTYGVKIAISNNSPIKTISSGTILLVEWIPNQGVMIMIDHGNNLISVYSQVGKPLVKKGEKVKMGQIISIPSKSNNNQFKFELWLKGNALNPLDFFDFN